MLQQSLSLWKRSAALVGLLAALAAMLTWACFYRLDPLDEGYFAATSQIVYEGGVPYRDFATPYTPGFFYVNAWLFHTFGNDLITLRVSLVVVRLVLIALLFVIARRLVPTPFSFLPAFLVLAMDSFPNVWESHPAWWGTLGFVVAVYATVRHLESGSLRWLAGAGAASALAFAFKQNLGFFALAATIGIAVAEAGVAYKDPSESFAPLRRPLAAFDWLAARVAPAAFCLALAAVVAWLVRAHAESAVIAGFVLPFVGLAAAYLRVAVPCQRGLAAALVARVGIVVAAFAMVTAPWLVTLVLVLGWQQTPIAAFLGSIDTAGYYLPMEALKPGVRPLLGLVLLAPILVWRAGQRAPLWQRAVQVAVLSAIAFFLARELFVDRGDIVGTPQKVAITILVRATRNLSLYAPALCFWPALVWLLLGRVPSPKRTYLRACMLASCLLLLNQYPRMDETHMIWSGVLVWIVLAYVLWRVYRGMLHQHMRANAVLRAALVLSLLGLPLAIAIPMLEDRREGLVFQQPDGRFTLPVYERMDLPRVRGIWEDSFYAWKFRLLYDFFQSHTSPSDRIFVYPVDPLFYYMLERRNATMQHHVFAGLVSDRDQQEIIRALDETPCNWVIWNTFGETFWNRPGEMQAIINYVWDNYEPVASIGGYEVLRKKA